jgi:hypothetical protein
VNLRPRQAFGEPCGVHLVVDERERDIVWLLLRKALEQIGDGRLN